VRIFAVFFSTGLPQKTWRVPSRSLKPGYNATELIHEFREKAFNRWRFLSQNHIISTEQQTIMIYTGLIFRSIIAH